MSQLLPSYLLFSYGKYFFRMRVPKELQPILKKKELKRAIPTTDRRVAVRAAIVYAADALEKFANLNSGGVMPDNPLLSLVNMEKLALCLMELLSLNSIPNRLRGRSRP